MSLLLALAAVAPPEPSTDDGSASRRPIRRLELVDDIDLDALLAALLLAA